MKVKILLTVDDSTNRYNEMMHTNHMPGRRVMTYEREVEIPDAPEGWGLDRIDIVKES